LRIWDFLTEERELAMAWVLEKEGKCSHLIGSAHFFPYKFRRALKRLAREARFMILEGPLELVDLREVARKGMVGEEEGLSQFLDEATLARLAKVMEHEGGPMGELIPGGLGFRPGKYGKLKLVLDGMRPWMAFFTLWVSHLERLGWFYHMDRDAFQIGSKMGCQVLHLESLEEQLGALEQIPRERILSFLKAVGQWRNYSRSYVRLYLQGDLKELLALSTGFPSRCKPVIDDRDRVLYQRMLPHLRLGGAVVMVGAPHTRAILEWLKGEGYKVRQVHIT
jgi:uncharacterized protein YbaP (TraB family)